jgi:predicted RNase H-like nuclease (RuvC/YqgF family)
MNLRELQSTLEELQAELKEKELIVEHYKALSEKLESERKPNINGVVVEALEIIKKYTDDCAVEFCESCDLYHICKSDICTWDLSFIEEFNIVY